MNDIANEISDMKCGVDIYMNVAILLYADDGALLSVSELGLQIRMHKPNQCANKWRLGIISPPNKSCISEPKTKQDLSEYNFCHKYLGFLDR